LRTASIAGSGHIIRRAPYRRGNLAVLIVRFDRRSTPRIVLVVVRGVADVDDALGVRVVVGGRGEDNGRGSSSKVEVPGRESW
jgi:hypothetical protein